MSNIQINSTPSRVQYTATASQTEFSVPFPWNSNSDIKVYQRAAGSTAVDADDLLTEGTGAGEYGLTGAGTADGGTVTLVTGATVGDIITIVGDDPVDRDTIINTPTKLTNTTLNTQFNNLVIYCKQLETTINQLMLRYNNNESLDSGLIIDNILPYLTAGGVWRKNTAGTAIEVATLPTYPVGSSGADFSNDNRMVKTDTSGVDNAVQETGVSISDADNISGVADFTMTGTLTASGLIYPTSDGVSGQVIKTDGAGNLAFTSTGDGDVDGPASATDNAVARFDSASGKLIQNSGVLISDANAISGVTDFDVDNININGNTISSTDTNGDINYTPDGTGNNVFTNNIVLSDTNGVLDENGNEQLIFGTTASAVNYLQIDNGDTGNGPTISVQGETNTDLNIQAAGTGNILFSGSNVICGDPGTESSGININGTTYNAELKVSDIGGTNAAQFIMNRHSTTLPSLIIGARSNSNDSSHSAVTNGQALFSHYAAGWTGSHYDLFGAIVMDVDSSGTVSATSAPGRIRFQVTADSAQTPTTAVTISNDKAVTFAGTVTLNADPTTSLQAATKQYVDANSASREWKDSVVAASDSAFTVTYDNGAAGVGATLTNAGAQAAFSIDGQSPSVGDRVLIKDQATAAQNGIYTVTTVGDGATNWVLTRATDHDEPAEMETGVALAVDAGTVNEATLWLQTSSVTTVGTDAVDFTQFGSAGDVVGPASSTDEAIARFNGTTGELLQDSSVLISDADAVSGVTQLDVDNIRVDGNTVSSTDTDGNVVIDPDGAGEIQLGSATVTVEQFIQHSGDANNQIEFGTDTQDFQTGGTSRMDISDSGVRLGNANARVTTVLDEDDMSSDSASALATQQSIKAYVDTSAGLGNNLLNNGSFVVYQRGSSFTSTTTPANSDDTYLIDQWIYLASAADTADVSVLPAGAPNGYGFGNQIQFQQATANEQWGHVQILSAPLSNTVTFKDTELTFFLNAFSVSSEVSNIKIAIIEWTGTVNSVTSDVVGTWAGGGTNPTLATNWSYVGTPVTCALTTNNRLYKITGTTSSSATNVGVFFWIDDTDAAVSDRVRISGCGLVTGSAPQLTNNSLSSNYIGQLPTKTVAEELLNCRHYYQEATITTNNHILGFATGANRSDAGVYIFDKMRAAPTITTTAADTFDLQDTSGTLINGNSISTFGSNSSGFFTLRVGVASGITAGDPVPIRGDAGDVTKFYLSSEL